MLKHQRQKKILDTLSKVGTMSIQSLAMQFNVSKNTIRRDLNDLVKSNDVKKHYGGVELLKEKDSPYQHRSLSNQYEKECIASYAASLINENDLIYIDSGTTTSLIIKYLDEECPLTFITNNLHAVSLIKCNPRWNLIVIGSTLNHSTQSLINVDNWQHIQSLNIDKAFMATTGLSLSSGATNPFHEEAIIKSEIVKKSKASYLLADSSKFDKVSLLTFSSIQNFDLIITSKKIPTHFNRYFQENKIKYVIASEVL